uniref:Gustatory receptor n=1 Tax=Tetranychus urticae TaxID=32264 RepID=A0A158P5P3_TETUR
MMPVIAKSFYNVYKMLENFFKNLKQFFSYLKTIPDSSEFDSKVWDYVRRTERLTINFQVVRNGLNQTDTNVNRLRYRRLNWVDWIIAINSLVNVLRATLLIFNTNDTIAFYLGDPFFRSKDRLPLLTWCALTIFVNFIFREWILYLEAKGKLKVLSIWKEYRDGAKLANLRMSNRNMKRFRFSIYFVSLVFHNVMIGLPIFLSFLFFTPILTNPCTYKVPKLAFFGIIWSFSVIFAVTFLLNSILGFGWYILCVLIFHLFRLLDLLDFADFLLKQTNKNLYTEKDIQFFSLLVIRRLNSFELAAFKLRYIFLCYVIVYSAAGDVYIFLGVIVRVYSNFFADLVAIFGIFILPTLGFFGLAFGKLITELDKLTIKLHQLTIRGKFSVNTMSKVLEIMDRVAGPYNGVKIGDFITLEKTFFILFILENITTLMLITINVRPLIST